MSDFTEKRIVLMYKNKPTESYYDDSYMFVDLDQSSGGYPTRATAANAYNFRTIEKAKQYDYNSEFLIVEMTIKFNIKAL